MGAALALGVMLAGCAEADPTEDAKYGAQSVCQDFVKKRLKAPSTADFSETTANESTTNPGLWIVKGAVDAENSFGANLRNTYRCKVKPAPDKGDDMWQLVNLTMK